MANVNDYLDAVVVAIKAALPELASCETHPGRFTQQELHLFATQTPAVRVALLSVPSVEMRPDRTRYLTLTLAAYVATINRPQLRRDVAAQNIVQALALLIPDNAFISTGTGTGAEAFRAENLYAGGEESKGCTIWACTWTQGLCVGEDVFGPDENFVVPTELYLGFDPDTGPDHVDDYILVDELPEV